MSHRALIAYEQADGTFSLHHSENGGRGHLRTAISKESPFGDGSNAEWAHEAVEQIRQGNTDVEGLSDHLHDSEISPVSSVTADSFSSLATDHLHFLDYETLHLVKSDWTIETWVPLWFGLKFESDTVVDAPIVGNGALVEIPDWTDVESEHQSLRTRWKTLKDVVGDGVDTSWLTVDEAEDYLREKLTDFVRSEELIWFSPTCSVGTVE